MLNQKHLYARIFRAIGDELDVQKLDTQQFCARKSDGTSVCVTGDQLAALLGAAATSQTTESVSSATSSTNSSATPPIIQINGDNPATIQVGDSYNDLGAAITGPQADLNLGITTYINGTEMSPVLIDTSEPATDTIDYVATDQSGLTATSTRTVIIEPAAASSTEATSAAQ